MVDTKTVRPSYDELPLHPQLGMPCAWDVGNHQLGSLGLLTPENRLAALEDARSGRTVGLNLPLGFLDPPLFGRAMHRHELAQPSRNDLEDLLHDFNPQSGSQWDGLQHVRAREAGFFGGYQTVEEAGVGIAAWTERGIVGRGVLLDLAAWWKAQEGAPVDPQSGRAITPDELDACAEWHGVAIHPGDVVCLRTGWVAGYKQLTAAERVAVSGSTSFVGLHAGESTARWLWDRSVAAIVADNPALECGPGDPQAGSLHRRLIPMLGIVIGELFDLDALAQECAERESWTFLFSAMPLGLVGGVSSTSNAVAIL